MKYLIWCRVSLFHVNRNYHTLWWFTLEACSSFYLRVFNLQCLARISWNFLNKYIKYSPGICICDRNNKPSNCLDHSWFGKKNVVMVTDHHWWRHRSIMCILLREYIGTTLTDRFNMQFSRYKRAAWVTAASVYVIWRTWIAPLLIQLSSDAFVQYHSTSLWIILFK